MASQEISKKAAPSPKHGHRSSKAQIERELEQIYAESPGDPPNMEEAFQIIKKTLLGASRVKVRSILRDPEFEKRFPRRTAGQRKSKKSILPDS